jgi:hypothetical protein
MAIRRSSCLTVLAACAALAVFAVPVSAKTPASCVTSDVPDLHFKDTNCDGIDGNVRRAVFVAPDGNDASPGTKARPLRTLAAAVRLAAVRHRDVYAALGTYDEGSGLRLAAGVSIYGGYSRTWKRSASLKTIVFGKPQAILGENVHGVTLQLLRVQGSAAPGVDASVYGIRLAGSSVRLDHVAVSAGDAVPGPDGPSAGPAGADGARGESSGGAATVAPPAPGGGGPGFGGGAGGVSPWCCMSGADGGPGGGPAGGAGGFGGPAVICTGCGAFPPVAGSTGGDGAAGAAAQPGAGDRTWL